MKAKRNGMPDRWLQGCALSFERQGFNPREAIIKALEVWDEQARLAEQFADCVTELCG